MGVSHQFQFENCTDLPVVLLLEEDPEGLMKIGGADLRLGAEPFTDFCVQASAGAHTVRQGARPHQEFSLVPHVGRTHDMKSSTILWSAAFSRGPCQFQVFRKRITMAAGSTVNILPKHIDEPLSQMVSSDNLDHAIKALASQ